ncbi:MAG: UDP-N-acetylmuramoyl-tripeptide--D-alanyl-D-alanine ligase [Deltaproteobacteria bacterium]|nr:UDP-N-acetylmuramoyl-tripeptide--D-alanyl-D-alanine ligase [Deltaproteobacteria bacterium]
MKRDGFTTSEVIDATGASHRAGEGSAAPATFAAVSTDTRSLSEGQLFVALEGERFDGHDFLATAAQGGATGAVVRAGHPKLADAPSALSLFLVPDTERALGDLARHHRRRFAGLPLVAITGSNGKTTTRALTAAALGASLGAGHATTGNLNNLIGVPLTLFSLGEAHAFSVVEMGMNAPGEIARLTEIAEPTLGLVTNAAGVHLEGLGSLEGVARAKAELYQGLPAGAVALANADDALLLPLAREAARTRGLALQTFGRAADADLRLLEVETLAGGRQRVTVRVGGAETLTFELGLLGSHNALNACAALAVARALGADLAAAAVALGAVEPVGRRLRRTTTRGGAILLDDCYNANLVSMGAALQTATALAALTPGGGGRVFAALGDMLELGPHAEAHHRELGALAARAGLEGLVAFGPLSASTAAAAREGGLEACQHTEEPAEAAAALGAAREGDVVLVKGSRGMRMERIVALLEEEVSA